MSLLAAILTLHLGRLAAEDAHLPEVTASQSPLAEPIDPMPLTVPVNPKRLELGEMLFKDVRLSGDNRRACSECHPLDKGGMDGKARAVASDGQTRLRNTPTLFNVGFNAAYNWDGKAATLEEHAQMLLTNAAVMNSNWPGLLAKLSSDRHYSALFSVAFPDGLTQTNLLAALAEFERSLITPGSRFDQYLRSGLGLSDEELGGYRLFKAYGCVACHQGVNVGGNLFQRFGVFQDPDALSATPNQDDPGRIKMTEVERDRGVFRVPSLRNVAVTAPYFHDGRAASLEAAVETMARVQLGRELSRPDLRAIVLFLRTLTGEYRGKPLLNPAGMPP